MQAKSKQRIVGLLILLAILTIFFPVLFHNTHPKTTQVPFSETIPAKPHVDNITVPTEKSEAVMSVPETVKPSVENIELKPQKDNASVSTPIAEVKSIDEAKGWVVQLGTFHNVENAKRLIDQLRKKGFNAYTQPILNKKGEHLLRVYVGPEVRREKADELRSQLQMTFKLNGVVTKYEVKA